MKKTMAGLDAEFRPGKLMPGLHGPNATGKRQGLRLPKVMLAPMAGISDWPFRKQVHRFGCSLAFTEMILCHELLNRRDRVALQLHGFGESDFTATQILGRNPEQMAQAASILEKLGADIIDINMGCPARKVVTSNGGSALMRDEVLAGRIMESVVRAVSVPVSLKCRLGWAENEITAPRIAEIAEQSGISFITVHARTRAQHMTGKADWERAAEVSSRVSIPMVINGDICTAEDARDALEKSGAVSVMIGRAALGAPWVPGRINAELQSDVLDTIAPPSYEERLAVIREHLESMLAVYGTDLGLKISRKHMIWYSKSLPGKKQWARRYIQARTLDEAYEALREAGNMLSWGQD